MIDAVKVNRMGEVVGVFQGYLYRIALLDANDGRRNAQQLTGLEAVGAFGGHTIRFRRKDPKPWLNTRGDRIRRD